MAGRLFAAAAAASMVGALALAGASSADAAQDNHQAQGPAFPALPAGAHVLTSGGNRYGSYEIVEQPATAPRNSGMVIRPASGGGCNTNGNDELEVCAALTGAGVMVDGMTNKSYFGGIGGTAEVQILNPAKAQLASWWGEVAAGAEVTAYWTPNRNEPTGWYCATTTYHTNFNDNASDCVQVS
ncbi:MAG TPA: hypothetical protein VHZ33_21970 [Trebonia sp.]|nr:hypothetical protein [Trebonia sp.]